MIVSQNCIDFDTKTCRFGHFSGLSYRGAHAGWPAGWLGMFGRPFWLKLSQIQVERLRESTSEAMSDAVVEDCTKSPFLHQGHDFVTVVPAAVQLILTTSDNADNSSTVSGKNK